MACPNITSLDHVVLFSLDYLLYSILQLLVDVAQRSGEDLSTIQSWRCAMYIRYNWKSTNHDPVSVGPWIL